MVINKKNYTIKITYPNGEVRRYEKKSKRAFLNKVATIKWQLCPLVYLRVSYGNDTDAFRKIQGFYNDGDYNNKKEFMQAFNAFIE
jgi:hypothetical protein